MEANGKPDNVQGDDCNTGSNHSREGYDHSERVRTSRLAVVACLLAVVGLLLLPGLPRILSKSTRHSVQEVYMCFLYAISLTAGLLGTSVLIQIGSSGGRLTGRGFAWAGAMAPVIHVFVFCIAVFPAIPRSVASRMTFGTNLSGIGKAMSIYANDYKDELPQAGEPTSQRTARIPDWTANTRDQAYELSPDGSGDQVGVSANLYLLVNDPVYPPAAVSSPK